MILVVIGFYSFIRSECLYGREDHDLIHSIRIIYGIIRSFNKCNFKLRKIVNSHLGIRIILVLIIFLNPSSQ